MSGEYLRRSEETVCGRHKRAPGCAFQFTHQHTRERARKTELTHNARNIFQRLSSSPKTNTMVRVRARTLLILYF